MVKIDKEYDYITKELLEGYLSEGLSALQIMKILNVSEGFIYNRMKKYNLKSNHMIKKKDFLYDKIGMRFGKLVVTEYKYTKNGFKYYLCKCDCGNEKVISGVTLGKVNSCGCLHKESNPGVLKPKYSSSHIGEKFGRLTTIGIEKFNDEDGYRMICLCECGNITKVKYCNLKRGQTTSCGCYAREQASKRNIGNDATKYMNKYKWYFIKNDVKINCRSSFEVFYANYLINNNINFEYESKHFKLAENSRYTPDFYLNDEDKYIEIKGSFDINNPKQKDKIKIVQQNHDLEIKYWEDIKKECNLKYVFSTYMRQAKRLNYKPEDYLGKQLYLNKSA